MTRSKPATRTFEAWAAWLVAGVALAAAPARAELAEDTLVMPTQSAATHLFPLNPAVHKSAAVQGGMLVIRNTKKTKLDQSRSNGDTIENEVNDDHVAFGALTDLGAGAGIGLSHATLYRRSETSFASDNRNQPPREELLKQQHSTLKLIVELTDALRAGLAIRYLYKDVVLLGSPQLGDDEKTRYKTTLVGYGSGFAYYFSRGALAYTYYPPLRGKTEIYGEEKIIVEPGQIAVDGYFQANAQWTVGILGKRWVNELDDRAGGTTAGDDQTNISLYGLDPDQYLFPQRLLMIGAEYQVTKQTSLAASIGQEEADFDFINLRRYNRLDVRQNQGDSGQGVKATRLRAMLKFVNQGIQLDAGLGYFTRKRDLPETMNSGVYDSNGKEMFATIGMKL